MTQKISTSKSTVYVMYFIRNELMVLSISSWGFWINGPMQKHHEVLLKIYVIVKIETMI